MTYLLKSIETIICEISITLQAGIEMRINFERIKEFIDSHPVVPEVH
jgi:hypothetical protein